MTREEAINWLDRLYMGTDITDEYGDMVDMQPYEEAFNMAIKALGQQPCEDCVSRKDLLKLYGNRAFELQKTHQTDKQLGINWCINTLNELPKVTPQPKTGHWIMPQQDDGMSDPIYYQVRCSGCGFDLDPQTWHQELHQYGADKYCPKCGAVMAESEDKE